MAASKRLKKRKTKKKRVFTHPKKVKRIVTTQKVKTTVLKEKKSLTTAELAKKLTLPHHKVYQICRSLVEKGLFRKGVIKPSEKRVLYAPLIGEVIDASSYERMKTLDKKLRRIIAKFSLEDPRLKQNLEKFFLNLLKKKEYEKYSTSINSFKKDLLRAVDSAEKKSDVRKYLGFRPFHPKERTWESSVRSSKQGSR
jgi:hypothetical protein